MWTYSPQPLDSECRAGICKFENEANTDVGVKLDVVVGASFVRELEHFGSIESLYR